VAYSGRWVCMVWHSGEGGYVLCDIAERKGMNSVA